MFKKQPLYLAKKDTLMAGAALINAQSKLMCELFDNITCKTVQLDRIKQKLDLIHLQEDSLLVLEKKALSDAAHSYSHQKVNMDTLANKLRPYIPDLEKWKTKILSPDNSMKSDHLDIFNIFGDKGHIKRVIPVEFLSGTAYLQVAATEEAFEIAQLNQKNMLDFRFLATVALMFTLDSVFLVGLVAAGIAIIVCVNPIAGVAVMLSTLLAFSLLHLFIAHDSRKFTSWVESFTNIAGAIDVGPADELFPEPYQLIR